MFRSQPKQTTRSIPEPFRRQVILRGQPQTISILHIQRPCATDSQGHYRRPAGAMGDSHSASVCGHPNVRQESK
eukprot:1910054-Pyramimonas_sp.AAC.1